MSVLANPRSVYIQDQSRQFWRSRAKSKLAKNSVLQRNKLLPPKWDILTEKGKRGISAIPHLNSISESDKNKQGSISAALSNLVGRTGFEPATPWSQTTYSTGLNYLPKPAYFL
jgi:hypothetical protein